MSDQPDHGTEKGDLGRLLEGRRRDGRSPLTTVLVGLMLVAIGAVGGILVGRSMGSGDDQRVLAAFPGDGQLPGGASGANGFPGPGGSATFGTIESMDGGTLTVQTPNGETVTVEVGDDTSIQVTGPGSLNDLATGDTIVVAGTRNGDTVAASSIAESGFGGAPGSVAAGP